MSEYGFTKKDWALFREKVADWQEAYMDKLNKEYIDLLNGDGRPSEKFWALEERIRNDKKDTGVQLRMSRSNCIYNIVSLLNEGAITMEDLEEFSDELKERVHFIAKQKALSIWNRAFIDERDYLAGIAAPASLLTHRVRGCNEIYHLK